MLDDNMTIPRKEATYEPLPEDMYQVELLDITAKETETYDSKQARKADLDLAPVMETVLDFQFVLLDGEDNGKTLRGRNLFENYVPSILYIGKKGKNKLYQIVETLQAQTLSPEQEAYGITGKDLNALIGKQCRVTVKNQTKGDKTYSNIETFLVAKTQLPALNAQEREDARIKSKDGESAVETDVTGGELTSEDVPSFGGND